MLSMNLNNRLAALLSDPFEIVRRDFERAVAGSGNAGTVAGLAAPLTLWEDENNVVLEIDAPGISRDELDLTFENGTLTIRGERKTTECAGKCWHDERRYGTFERTVTLGDTLDANSVDASLADGVLRISLAKKPEAKPHKITVKSHNAAGEAN